MRGIQSSPPLPPATVNSSRGDFRLFPPLLRATIRFHSPFLRRPDSGSNCSHGEDVLLPGAAQLSIDVTEMNHTFLLPSTLPTRIVTTAPYMAPDPPTTVPIDCARIVASVRPLPDHGHDQTRSFRANKCPNTYHDHDSHRRSLSESHLGRSRQHYLLHFYPMTERKS